MTVCVGVGVGVGLGGYAVNVNIHSACLLSDDLQLFVEQLHLRVNVPACHLHYHRSCHLGSHCLYHLCFVGGAVLCKHICHAAQTLNVAAVLCNVDDVLEFVDIGILIQHLYHLFVLLCLNFV